MGRQKCPVIPRSMASPESQPAAAAAEVSGSAGEKDNAVHPEISLAVKAFSIKPSCLSMATSKRRTP